MAQPAEFQTRDTPSPELPVGEILRRTRVHYNKSIEDVEAALRIRADQITAIEQGDNEKLPARVYAIGFIRSYSEFLGLDGEKMVALFKAQSGIKIEQPNLKFPVTANDSKAPPLWLAALCVVIVIIGLSLYMNGQTEDRAAVEAIPEVPAALKAEALEKQQQAAPSQSALNDPQEQPPAAPVIPAEPVRKGISLNIKENSWVEIRGPDNKKIISRVLKEGEKYFIPERENLTMSIGNAGGIEIEIDGQPLQTQGATLGPKGQVMRGIPLNGEVLKQRFAPESASITTNAIETLAQ